MKVCHIITSLDIGGAELVLYRLLTAQADNVNNITVITLKPGGILADKLQQAGFVVHSLNVTGPLSLLASVTKLAKKLEVLQPQVVQSWLYHADFITALSSLRWRATSYVWGIHTCQLPKGKIATWAIMKSCALLSYRVPSKIVCVAEASKILHVNQGYDAKKVRVISNGFSLTDYQAVPQNQKLLRNELGVADSALVVGIIARWHPDKGQDVLLKAIQKIQPQHPNVIFLFVGRDCDSNNQQLMQYKNSCPFPDNILTIGQRSDIPALLNTLDIFCMPSRTEAFPLALGEAMCASLPVVATEVGDVAYMTGNLVELAQPDNVTSLAEKLDKMLSLPKAQRRAVGNALFERVSALFSIETMVHQYQALYAEISA